MEIYGDVKTPLPPPPLPYELKTGFFMIAH